MDIPASDGPSGLDRTRSPTPPELVPAHRVGRIRGLLHRTSSSYSVPSPPHCSPCPQRRKSVRFRNPGEAQLDGPTEQAEKTPVPSPRPKESSRSSLGGRISEQLDHIGAKLLSTPGTDTVVHRPRSRQRPGLPHVDTNVSGKAGPLTVLRDDDTSIARVQLRRPPYLSGASESLLTLFRFHRPRGRPKRRQFP